MGNNQPKKYRNFMIGAASAALVATAVAPVASAADFSDVKGNTHEPAIKALVEAGVINGYPDGTFQPNKTLTRSDVVKMMGKWLVSLDYKVPADYKTNPRFKDLTSKSNDELLKYAALVKDHGVFNGYADGTLGAGLDITRENMAIVLVRAYDAIHKTDLVTLVKETEFNKDVTDLAKAKAEARPYIDVLDYFDITNPVAPQFNPKNTTTRGQFASFLYKTSNVNVEDVEDTEAPKLVYTGEKTLNVEYGKEFTAPVVTATDNVDEEIEVTSVITNEAGERLTAIDTKVPGTYKVTYSAVDAAGNSAEDVVVTVVVAKPATPAVEAVTALNATQVQVKFNTEVDKTEAQKVENYKINSTTPDTAVLASDNKTVLLTFTQASAVQVDNGVITVEPISTLADKKVKTTKLAQVFSYKDEVAPLIDSVEAITSGNTASTVTIKASEPLKATIGLVKVNGQYVTANFNNTDTAVVSGLALEVGKTHTVELINIEDLAGNKTVTTSKDFTVNVDAEAPAVSLSAKSEKEILVTFSKKMDAKSVVDSLVNGSVKNEALADVTTGKVSIVEGSNNTQFVIPVNETIFGSNASRTFTVVIPETIKDSLGNKITASTPKVTLVKDTVKPVATGYKVVKDDKGLVSAIEVNFNEGLKAAGEGSISAPSIVSENGVLANDLLGGFTSQKVEAGDTKVVFKAKTPAVVTGKYNFTIAQGSAFDLAETANSSDAITYTIDFGQVEVKPTFDVASAEGKDNVITVTFNEQVKGGAVANSATDVNNYTLGGKPLPANTTITLDSAQKVATITLPVDSVKEADKAAVFTVANIASTDGKTLNTYKGTVEIIDNTAPVLQSARVINNKTIELTYSEAVTVSTEDVFDAFEVIEGTTAKTLAAGELKANSVSGFDNKVTITLVKKSGEVEETFDISKVLTVKTNKSTNIVDKAVKPNAQKAGISVTVAK
ncbi:S-layer homology domain-containing protein [Sporosarcina luteola]|uniref:S-layer homology domain-containing protein n=1 Tax=Sporosarcina luteola TaxID=582850 RepID=UPI00203E6C68|nr:S-layer homology domain-containing protein [Sporosarcina luteola]MCM3710180.1 S-layer homology domain-containing protein [Sporosarcina luteola]